MTRSKQQSSNVTADRVTTTVRARMSDMVTHRKAARLQHPTLIYAQPRLIMHAMLKSAMLPRSLHAARRCSTKSEMSAKTLCRNVVECFEVVWDLTLMVQDRHTHPLALCLTLRPLTHLCLTSSLPLLCECVLYPTISDRLLVRHGPSGNTPSTGVSNPIQFSKY